MALMKLWVLHSNAYPISSDIQIFLTCETTRSYTLRVQSRNAMEELMARSTTLNARKSRCRTIPIGVYFRKWSIGNAKYGGCCELLMDLGGS